VFTKGTRRLRTEGKPNQNILPASVATSHMLLWSIKIMILPWDFAIPRSFVNIYIQNTRVLLRRQSEDSLARAVKNIFLMSSIPWNYCRELTGDSPGKVHTLLHTLICMVIAREVWASSSPDAEHGLCFSTPHQHGLMQLCKTSAYKIRLSVRKLG
jgi:hypothetical protein